MVLLGGQFKSATHGQFESAQGGLFDRNLHYNVEAINKCVFLQHSLKNKVYRNCQSEILLFLIFVC